MTDNLLFEFLAVGASGVLSAGHCLSRQGCVWHRSKSFPYWDNSIQLVHPWTLRQGLLVQQQQLIFSFACENSNFLSINITFFCKF